MTPEQRARTEWALAKVPAAAPIIDRMWQLRAELEAARGDLRKHNAAQQAYNDYAKSMNTHPAMIELAAVIRAGR